jgi:hypothetical protein
MSPVVAVPVLRRRVGVLANVAGVCMSPVVSLVVCVSCVLCRKWLVEWPDLQFTITENGRRRLTSSKPWP